jgi:hypothetical protein
VIGDDGPLIVGCVGKPGEESYTKKISTKVKKGEIDKITLSILRV